MADDNFLCHTAIHIKPILRLAMWETGAPFDETLNRFQNDPRSTDWESSLDNISDTTVSLDQACGNLGMRNLSASLPPAMAQRKTYGRLIGTS